MRRALLLAILLALPALASPAAAQAEERCGDRDATLRYWRERTPGIPASAPQLRALNATLFPRLQLGSVEELRASCDLLDALLGAHDPSRPVDLAVADVQRASEAARPLREEKVVVEPAAMEAGRVVGRRLHDEIAAMPATQARIERLATLVSLYESSFLGAEAIQASLWRAAEAEAWTSDAARVEADLAEAERMTQRVSGLATSVVAIARVPDVLERLDADRRLMASHGDAGVAQIDAARERLQAAQTRGVALVLVAAAATMLLAAGATGIARPVLRRMESDLSEVEGARG